MVVFVFFYSSLYLTLQIWLPSSLANIDIPDIPSFSLLSHKHTNTKHANFSFHNSSKNYGLFAVKNKIKDVIPEDKRCCEPGLPSLTSITIPSSNSLLMMWTGRPVGSGGQTGDHMQFSGV